MTSSNGRDRFWRDSFVAAAVVLAIAMIGSATDAATRDRRCYNLQYRETRTFLEKDITPGDRLGVDSLDLTDEELQRLDAPHERWMRRLERRFERREEIVGCSRASSTVRMQALEDAMNDMADKRNAEGRP